MYSGFVKRCILDDLKIQTAEYGDAHLLSQASRRLKQVDHKFKPSLG